MGFSRMRLLVWWVAIALLGGGVRGAAELEKVTLQLKWKHQFQFAGYYAAIAQGYYRDVGLDVRLVEAQPGRDPVEAVLAGQAEFGVGTSELLLLRGKGRPVVVLAAIYQHSPLVLLARQTTAVDDLQALHDQPIMIEPQSAELFAYFKNEGVDPARLRIEPHTFDVQTLIDGKVAAMSAYASDEPYVLKQANIDYLTFTPRAGGIDFYGDNLFTTEAQIAAHPERVKKFREASLRGWDYALAHPQEIVELIRRDYSARKTAAHLAYEAEHTRQLMHPGVIEVGHMNPGRWRHIADTYAEFGMLPASFDLRGFLYDPDPRPDLRWVYWTLAGLGVLALTAVGWALPLVRLNRELRAAKAAAEKANDAKTTYLAFMTHELRTPLSGMLSVIELLQNSPLNVEQRGDVDLLKHSSQDLLLLLDSVLDASKLQAGRVEVEPLPVNPADLVGSVRELYRATASVKNIDLTCTVSPGVPARVKIDPTRVRQILANLTANALKFTAHGGVQLLLTSRPVDGQPLHHRLIFSVRDTGIGIPAAQLGNLFKAYEQADVSVTRRFGGTGLGLSISRQLAHLLGGDITVESVEGKGSTFVLEIPAVELVS